MKEGSKPFLVINRSSKVSSQSIVPRDKSSMVINRTATAHNNSENTSKIQRLNQNQQISVNK